MKHIWKYFLSGLLCMTTVCGAFAQDSPSPAEAVADAAAAVTEAAEGAAEAFEKDSDYVDMVAAQGDHAYAFDFFTTSMLWTVIAAALVFIMHLGFATLESGLTQSKNTVNILFKNVFIIAMGILTYAFLGFNTHYPGDFNGSFRWAGRSET
jgi:Amt family ammonium transporter